MLSRLLFFIFISVTFADVVNIRKKPCTDVDSSQCAVNYVAATQCDQGPAYCVFKRNKKYGLTVNMTPRFTAQKLKFAMYGDVYNDDTFRTVIKAPEDGCAVMPCPLRAGNRTVFETNIVLNKRTSGKFPVKVKVWDEENESKACCFTFTVKVK